MDDFSSAGTVNYFGVPATEPNYIKPGKRPMSSMAPLIVLDQNDDVRLLLGAGGGMKIITSVALVTFSIYKANYHEYFILVISRLQLEIFFGVKI